MNSFKRIKIKNVVTFKTGKLDSNAAENDGKYPFFTCAQQTSRINKHAFDTECVLLAGNNAAGIFPLKYYKGKFNAYQRTYIIEPIDINKLEIRYVYYALRPFLKHFKQSATGVTTKFLTLGILHNLDIPLPSLPIQKKIAAILSAYDDLIENNNRRIAILENMAEEIYCEWFVRMRFPGYETVKFHKGVPEGWKVEKVNKLGKIITGKTPSTKLAKYYNGDYLFIKTPDMHANMFVFETEETLTEEGLKSQPSQTIPKNSICVSCIGTGGVVSITTGTCQTNQQINTVVLREESDLEWAFFTLRNLKETIKLFGATGTTMTNLSKGKFSSIKILLPYSQLREAYHDTVNPIFDQTITIVLSNSMLRKTRDLLLSRLLSGKLSVENLDIKFPPGMKEADA